VLLFRMIINLIIFLWGYCIKEKVLYLCINKQTKKNKCYEKVKI